MANQQQHIIHELIIDLGITEEKQSTHLHEDWTQFIQHRLAPMIEHHCNEIAGPDELISVDHFTLDLGVLPTNNLKLHLQQKMRQELAHQLPSVLREAQKEIDPAIRALSLLRQFITTGTLPWWTNPTDNSLLDRAVTTILTKQPQALWKFFLQVAGQPAFLRRLILHLSDTSLLACTTRFRRRDAGVLHALTSPSLLAWIQEHAFPVKTIKAIRSLIWETAFLKLSRPSGSENRKDQFLPRLARALQLDLAVLNKRLELSDTFHRQEEIPIQEESASDLNDIDEPLFAPDQAEEVREIWVENAGLALLGPFLLKFFRSAGLVEEKTFINEMAPHQAVQLLQYLVTGQPEIMEYQLPLNKVLCGLPLEAVWDASGELSEEQMEEADCLLESVIAHAERLGNISTEGFRHSFLRRRGILSFDAGHWLLSVENETHDILLQQLPWSFRVVKLPWMEHVLYVEWRTTTETLNK